MTRHDDLTRIFHLGRRWLLALALLAALWAGAALAQTLGPELGWFSVAGGGGTSTGSGYTLSGTLGQPAAGLLGGGYTLEAGFWVGVGSVGPGSERRVYLPSLQR